MNSFIRAAEVWQPSEDGHLLEWAAAWYRHAPALAARSPQMVFGRAEGLPGLAWDLGHPVMLNPLEAPTFRRTEQARAAGLRAAVALPVFKAGQLTSLVVLFCGDAPEDVGAIELWRNDARVSTDLSLAGAYYGSTAESLEALSRDGSMARGTGAPGLAWQRGGAVLIDKVSDSPRFLRAQVAAQAGIVRALALPCSTRTHDTWVLSLLGSTPRPIARRVECWLPADDGVHLMRASGHCEVQGRLGADPAVPAPPVVQRAGSHQVACLENSADGLEAVLALPIIGDDDRTSEVVTLAF